MSERDNKPSTESRFLTERQQVLAASTCAVLCELTHSGVIPLRECNKTAPAGLGGQGAGAAIPHRT